MNLHIIGLFERRKYHPKRYIAENQLLAILSCSVVESRFESRYRYTAHSFVCNSPLIRPHRDIFPDETIREKHLSRSQSGFGARFRSTCNIVVAELFHLYPLLFQLDFTVVQALDSGQSRVANAVFTKGFATLLECFLNDKAHRFNLSAGLTTQVYHPH